MKRRAAAPPSGGELEPWESALRKGRRAEAEGRFAQAEAGFREALALCKEPSAAAADLARFLAERGRIDEARAELERALKRSRALILLVMAGQLAERAGVRAEAEKSFLEAESLDPASARPCYERGRFLERGGRREEAAAAYLAALAREKGHAEARSALERLRRGLPMPAQEAVREGDVRWEKALRRARRAEAAGRFEEAEAAFREAASGCPDPAAGICDLARFLAERGRIDEARAELSRALERSRALILLLMAGQLAERVGARAEAERFFLEAEKVDPTSARPCCERGRLLERAGRGGEAAAAYARALERDAGCAEARVALARLSGGTERGDSFSRAAKGALGPARFQARMSVGRWAEAFADGEALLRAGGFPDLVLLWRPWDDAVGEDVWRRRLSELEGLPPSAGGWAAHYACAARYFLSDFEGASRVRLPAGKERAWMRLWRGRSRLQRMDYEGALKDFECVRRGRPTHWYADAWAAETLVCSGKAARGLALMDKARPAAARAGAPGHWCAWKGKLLLWLGRFADAEILLSTAAEMGSPYAPGWRGAARLLLGRLPEAERDFLRGAELRPDDEEALVWRAELALRCRRREEADALLSRLEGSSPEGKRWALLLRALRSLRDGRKGAAAVLFRRLFPRERKAFFGTLRLRSAAQADGLLEELFRSGVRRNELYAQGARRRRGA